MERNEIEELIKAHEKTEDLIEKAFLSYILANKIYSEQIKGIENNYSQQSFEIATSIDNELLVSTYDTTENRIKKAYLGFVLCNKLTQAGHFEIGRNYGIEALEIATTIDDLLMTLDLTSTLGQSFAEQGLIDEARIYFEKSLIYAEKSPSKADLANAYDNLGYIEYSTSHRLKSLEYFIKAVTILESEKNDSPNLIHFYSNIATNYLEIKKYDEAKKYLKKALKLNKQLLYSLPLLSFGNFYREIGDIPLAMGYFKKCLEVSQKNQQMFYIIESNQQIGNLYLQKGRYEEALRYFNESLDLSKKNEYHLHYFKANCSLGETYTTMKKYDDAKTYFEDAILKITNIVDESELYLFYKSYHFYLSETKQFEEAYEALLKCNALNEQLNSKEHKKNMAYLAESFESEQKTREIDFITKKNEELLVYQSEIINQKEDLIKLNEEKDAILLTISHDLKNSIGSIKSALDILALKEKEIFEHKYLKIITKSTEQSLALVKEILYSNKIDQEESQLALFDINKSILTLYDNLNLIAQKKEIELSLNLADEPLQCMIDLEKFDRIIDNLCMNAIKFTNAGGTIEIKTQKNGDVAQLHIKDSGIGMDETMIKKLFEKFSKAGRKGTSGEESTGLGLYIVKTLVEKIGGSVEVFSEVNKGTEFVIKLPLGQ